MEKIKAVVFIGPPGCGKGTISKMICNNSIFSSKYVHFSTGDYIRSKLKDFTGAYLDDDVIFGFVKEKLLEFEGKIVILDGLPRTVSQLSMCEELFEVKVYFLFGKISSSNLIDRMSSRLRENEDLSMIKKRLDDYNEKTLPLFNFILNSDKLSNKVLINCDCDVNEVYSQILLRL